jgi:hypothetical protein
MDMSKADFHVQRALLQIVEVISVAVSVSTSKLIKPFSLLYILTPYCWSAIFLHRKGFNLFRIVLVSPVFHVTWVVAL